MLKWGQNKSIAAVFEGKNDHDSYLPCMALQEQSLSSQWLHTLNHRYKEAMLGCLSQTSEPILSFLTEPCDREAQLVTSSSSGPSPENENLMCKCGKVYLLKTAETRSFYRKDSSADVNSVWFMALKMINPTPFPPSWPAPNHPPVGLNELHEHAQH